MGYGPGNAREALDMVRAGLGYLAAADATQLPAATQADCLANWNRPMRSRPRRGPRSWPVHRRAGLAGDAEYSRCPG